MKTLATLLIMISLAACGTDESASKPESQPMTQTETEKTSGTSAAQLSTAIGDEWVFIDKPMHFYDAESNAPDGYRLPERWELIKAFDEGIFETINTMLWTQTSADEDGFKVWRIVLSNMPGYLVTKTQVENKQNYNYAAYIKVD